MSTLETRPWQQEFIDSWLNRIDHLDFEPICECCELNRAERPRVAEWIVAPPKDMPVKPCCGSPWKPGYRLYCDPCSEQTHWRDQCGRQLIARLDKVEHL